MSLNVDNCPRCGKIYVKNNFSLCVNCIKEIDQQYEKCLNYLRENRSCYLYELSEATGVSIKQITKFIREGRISIANHPNMSYNCEVCNTPIRVHTICDSCRQKLSKEASNMQEDEQRKQKLQKEGNHMSYNIQDRLRDRHN
ncbi:flagellar protein [Paenibacillus doosanensis]|uniref:flagellar protein n=1 Tax=Paenibacillus doosanensis TaxID=1229154 RepID=UPI0021806B74|nr:flagellar protein [Paenibacillus doosanensis]MCS7459957.1 flagellar protein [Paenibacillus doosanensis]